jgi:hypothetical protein
MYVFSVDCYVYARDVLIHHVCGMWQCNAVAEPTPVCSRVILRLSSARWRMVSTAHSLRIACLSVSFIYWRVITHQTCMHHWAVPVPSSPPHSSIYSCFHLFIYLWILSYHAIMSCIYVYYSSCLLANRGMHLHDCQLLLHSHAARHVVAHSTSLLPRHTLLRSSSARHGCETKEVRGRANLSSTAATAPGRKVALFSRNESALYQLGQSQGRKTHLAALYPHWYAVEILSISLRTAWVSGGYSAECCGAPLCLLER